MPPFDGQNPRQWLTQMEEWFSLRGIIDSHLQYAVIAATQTPAQFAVLSAARRDFPDIEPFVLARRHVLRQCRQESSVSNPNDSNPQPPAEVRTIQPGHSVQTTERTTGRPTNTHSVTTVTMQSLSQLEEMLLAEIHEIRHDVAELQALYPSRRNQPASSQRTTTARERSVQRFVTPSNSDECWYHQAYGPQAKLCGAPCRHRRP